MADLTRARRDLPRFSRVEASPPLTKEFVERLLQIPMRPSAFRSLVHMPYAVRELSEYILHAPRWFAKGRNYLLRYPKPFRKVSFPSLDGISISAWVGVHKRDLGAQGTRPRDREAILIVPGMFTTKDNSHIKSRALRFYEEWGYHVLVIDPRGMGESSRSYNTAGWKEAEDVEAAVEYFRAHTPIEKLHIFAESMGAVATILALARKAERGFRLVDGAVLAWSPYPSAKQMIQHLMKAKPGLEMAYATQWFFGRLLRLGGHAYPNFEAYLRHAAKQYKTPLTKLYERSRAVLALKHVNVPLLIICSDDDPLVPRGAMRAFERALRGRDNPAIIRLPWGGHCLYEELDPAWFWDLTHEFFDFYCVLPDSRANLRKP